MRMQEVALAGFGVAALACNSRSHGKLSPPSNPEAPIRSAWRREMPSQVFRRRRPNGISMMRSFYQRPGADTACPGLRALIIEEPNARFLRLQSPADLPEHATTFRAGI